MSKNFELMQQARVGMSGSATAAVGAAPARAKAEAEAAAQSLSAEASSAREESMRLVQRLFLTPGQTSPRAVLFTAVDAGTGCSRLCAEAAQLLAASVSGSVCLLEGNFRTPILPGLFGVENHHGLADSLRHTGTIRGFAKQVARENLWLLSSGSLGSDSLSLLNSDRLRERVTELRHEFDYLLIDAPSLGSYADGMAFGPVTDGVVLVLEANTTRREAALRIVESLRSAKIPVLGAVLNDRTFPIPAALYKRL